MSYTRYDAALELENRLGVPKLAQFLTSELGISIQDYSQLVGVVKGTGETVDLQGNVLPFTQICRERYIIPENKNGDMCNFV
jgi:hypothetical protein